MSLMKQIQTDQVQARKNKDAVKASVLTTLIGEAAMIGKNAGNRDTTNDEVVKVVTKFVKGIDETLALIDASDARVATLRVERDVLAAYLPKQLTADELRAIILAQFPEKTAVGAIMGFLKANYNGQYDGKTASTLVNTLY